MLRSLVEYGTHMIYSGSGSSSTITSSSSNITTDTKTSSSSRSTNVIGVEFYAPMQLRMQYHSCDIPLVFIADPFSCGMHATIT